MNASSAGRVVDILLVEDDPGDELITREAFADNKIKNTLHVARDGQEDFNRSQSSPDHQRRWRSGSEGPRVHEHERLCEMAGERRGLNPTG